MPQQISVNQDEQLFQLCFVVRIEVRPYHALIYFPDGCSVIVEALKVDSLQKLCSSLEPILRRVVS